MGQIADYTTIADVMRDPRAAGFIAEASGRATQGMSGEALLKIVDEHFPGTQLGGQLGQQLWTKAGLKAASQRELHFQDTPYAYVMLGLFCACARERILIDAMDEPRAGAQAILGGSVPSSIFAFEGELLLTVQEDRSGFAVEGQTIFRGQMMDWGRGKRLLATLFGHAEKAVRTYKTLDL